MTGENVRDVATSAIDAMRSNPMCLALLILSLSFVAVVYFSSQANRARQHDEFMTLYGRCLSAQTTRTDERMPQ